VDEWMQALEAEYQRAKAVADERGGRVVQYADEKGSRLAVQAGGSIIELPRAKWQDAEPGSVDRRNTLRRLEALAEADRAVLGEDNTVTLDGEGYRALLIALGRARTTGEFIAPRTLRGIPEGELSGF
jgi:hypothetical protein